MSDAGDDIPVDSEAPVAVEVTAEAPKGKLSVEDALQVGFNRTNQLYR
jgi:small subunit ribosomal protein S12e